MEDLLSQNHSSQIDVNITKELSQSLKSQDQDEGNGILITSNKESKAAPFLSQPLTPFILTDNKNDNSKDLTTFSEGKENIMLIENTNETISIEQMNQKNMEEEDFSIMKNGLGKDSFTNPSINKIKPEDTNYLVDEILFEKKMQSSDEKETKLNKALENPKRKRLKKLALKSEEFSDDDINEKIDEICDEGSSKKTHIKKHYMKSYNDLVSSMQSLSKFDWFEGTNFHQKLTSSNYLTQNVVWFIICANYFPKHAFAHKNPKELFQQRVDKLKSFVSDVTERITKADIKNELIQKNSLDEHECVFIDNIRKAIKACSAPFVTNQYLKKTMSSRNITTAPKTTYTSEDDEWIVQTRRYLYDSYKSLQDSKVIPNQTQIDFRQNINLISKIDLQDLIALYEKDLYDSTVHNEKLLDSLEKNVIKILEEEEPVNRLKFDPNNSISDLKVDFPEDEQFIALLEKKLNESKDLLKISLLESGATAGKSSGNNRTSEFKPKILIDDMVCYICNDGDYTDDDLIVFCSKCNISVHQMCYGIPIIPKGDWTCSVCLNFGEKGKYLRCPLCDKRGGAMKPTNTRADSDLFEATNPTFHEFLKSYATPEFIKNAPKTILLSELNIEEKELGKDDETKASNEESETDFSENLYYDIQFLDDKFTEQELMNEPKPICVWVHMTCALFIPELYFDDEYYISNVLALETIQKDRFKYECEVCKTKKNGAIIQCGKGTCKKAFHPECARRAQYFLDIRENESNQLTYHIFCEKHTPLKLKRSLESREKKMKEEIQQFFKLVDKSCLSALTISQHINLTESNPSKSFEKRTKKHEKKEDASYFMNLVQKYTPQNLSQLTMSKPDPEENSLVSEVLGTDSLKLPVSKKLTPDDPIWAILPYKNLTPEEKYKKYRKILSKLRKKQKEQKGKETRIEAYRKNIERAREVKNQLYKQRQLEKEQAKSSLRIEKKEIKTQEEVEIRDLKNRKYELIKGSVKVVEKKKRAPQKTYCLCNKVYRGELMTACEGCEEWYHPDCLGIPKSIKLNTVKWWCKKCSGNKGYEEADIIIEDKLKQIYIKRVNSQNLEKEEPSLVKKVKPDSPLKDKEPENV